MRNRLDPVVILVGLLALGIFVTAATSATDQNDANAVDVPALQRGVTFKSNE
ncbi:MAG: hypothetical protein RL336_133 [Pseudomonadota bacterium]|jgi:hypothetical protein